MKREAVAWWDETHLDVKVGFKRHKKVKNVQVFVRFPRDSSGRAVGEYEESTYSDDTEKIMKCKYTDEMCFALGVAIVITKNGTREGRRCEMIDYTG